MQGITNGAICQGLGLAGREVPPEERFKFPRVVAARDWDVYDGEARTGECLVNKDVSGLPVGPVMAAVVQFYGDEGPERFRVAQQEVNVLLTDLPEGTHVAPVVFKNVRLPHFH